MFSASHKRKTTNVASLSSPSSTKDMVKVTSCAIDDNGKGNKCSTHVLLPRLVVSGSVLLFVLVMMGMGNNNTNINDNSTNTNQWPYPDSSFSSGMIVSPRVSNAEQYLKQQGQTALCQQTDQDRLFNASVYTPPKLSHKMVELLEGPALDPKFLDHIRIASCKFVQEDTRPALDLEMALQQLVKCVSWWQFHRLRERNRTLTLMLVGGGAGAGAQRPRRMIEFFLVWPNQAPRENNFLAGFLGTLRRVWNIKVVPLRGGVPVVRTRATRGMSATQAFATVSVRDLQQLRQDVVSDYFPHRYENEVARQLTLPASMSILLPSKIAQEDVMSLEHQQLAGQRRKYQGASFTNGESSDPSLSLQNNPRILILNRQAEQGRSILNAQELVKALETALTPSNLETASVPSIRLLSHIDNVTYLELMRIMVETDILISPHGPQLAAMLWQPRCGVVIEVFGRGLVQPELYGGLAASRGLKYRFLYTGHVNAKQAAEEIAYWMKDADTTMVARLFPICVPIDSMVRIVQEEIQAWMERTDNPLLLCE